MNYYLLKHETSGEHQAFMESESGCYVSELLHWKESEAILDDPVILSDLAYDNDCYYANLRAAESDGWIVLVKLEY